MSPPKYWLSASVLTITSAPSFSAGVEPGLEGRRQALVVRQPDDVVDAVLARDLDGAVGGAVVDDEPLDRVDARDLAREVGERRRAAVASSLKQGIWMMSFMWRLRRVVGRVVAGMSSHVIHKPLLC